ncbi:MAG: response regulator, partial [Chloroflexi bacterium]|nr:response regulator [Chloroflexota bacterium]
MSEPRPDRLLIIDDEVLIRRALADYLAECGYECTTAADGVEGLALARSQRFDAVLVDLRMPHMDGLEVIATLQDEQPEVPVTVVSGTGVLNDAIEAMRLGAQDYVTKPIQDMDEVVVVVRRVMERARLMAERDRYQRELETEVARQTRDLEALSRVSYAISDPLDITTMLHRAVDAAIAAMDADGGVVRLLDPATNHLVMAAARGIPDPYLASAQAIPLGQGIIGQVAQDGRARAGVNLTADPWMTHLEQRFGSYLCVPLRTGDEGSQKHPIVGTLGVATQARQDFDAREVALLSAIGNQIGVAVARAQGADELKQANLEMERLLTQTREQARRLRQIIDTVPDGMMLLDATGHVILANPVIEQMLPMLMGQLAGRPLTHLGDYALADLLAPPP